jgi:hypothetical protein
MGVLLEGVGHSRIAFARINRASQQDSNPISIVFFFNIAL